MRTPGAGKLTALLGQRRSTAAGQEKEPTRAGRLRLVGTPRVEVLVCIIRTVRAEAGRPGGRGQHPGAQAPLTLGNGARGQVSAAGVSWSAVSTPRRRGGPWAQDVALRSLRDCIVSACGWGQAHTGDRPRSWGKKQQSALRWDQAPASSPAASLWRPLPAKLTIAPW